MTPSTGKKVVLVSSGQPSLNPRLVKEADALADAGYTVKVIYSYWNTWGTELDKTLLLSKKWTAIRAGGDPIHKPLIYLLSKVLHKIYYHFIKLTGIMYLSPLAIARSSFFLIAEAKKHMADLYIGHNLGAIIAVVAAAKKHGKPCGFDAEDFHRNEVSDDPGNLDVKIKTNIENRCIARLQYLTVSSPLIGEAYQRLYPQIKPEVILNSFPLNTVSFTPANSDKTLKLFWFSQTVGLGRGIEDVIQALHRLTHSPFELHLLGDANDAIQKEFAEQIHYSVSTIHFHPPIPPDEIISFAAQFDLGIASESCSPFNRDICLTNKIFTYIQAGLPVLASDTSAQKAFVKQYGIAGKVYINNNPENIADAISYYNDNRAELHQQKIHNYNLGQTVLNWGTDKTKFLHVINQSLSV